MKLNFEKAKICHKLSSFISTAKETSFRAGFTALHVKNNEIWILFLNKINILISQIEDMWQKVYTGLSKVVKNPQIQENECQGFQKRWKMHYVDSTLYNYLMFPFDNNIHNQYIADHYSASGYFGNQLYYVPQDAVQMVPSFMDNSNQEFPFQLPFHTTFPPLFEECPIKIQQRETRASEAKDDNESSVSANNLEESEEHSPQLRFKQKYGRNINSNIFHHMLRKLLIQKDMVGIITKVIDREGSVLSVKEFMQFLTRKEEKLRTYVSFQKMTKMFKGQKYRNRIYELTLIKEREFCKIFRIVSRYYLKNVHPLHVYNMLKLKAQSKRLHITGSRRILQLMETN